jgi:hypothetical protein
MTKEETCSLGNQTNSQSNSETLFLNIPLVIFYEVDMFPFLIVLLGIDPGFLPRPKILLWKYLVYCSYMSDMKFLAVHWVRLMTLLEFLVDRPFPYHVTRCWVRTQTPREDR